MKILSPISALRPLLDGITGVSNFWECSAQGFRPVAESKEAYKLGVNYIMYALTHYE